MRTIACLVVLASGPVFAQTNQLATTNQVSGARLSATNVLAVKQSLPKLLDLGANKCVPCKLMAPILEQLKTDYAGQLEVEFIDVWKNQEAGARHKIKMIPTQIFFAADGKELFRHDGFFGKADILAKWKELGVELKPGK